MSLLFLEGFELYNTVATDIPRRWTSLSQSGATLPAGRLGGKCVSASGSLQLSRTLPASVATVVVGAAVRLNSALDSNRLVLTLTDAGTAQLSVAVGLDHCFRVYRGTAIGTLLGTSSVSLVTGVWYYIELKATINNTTGTYEVRLNGVNVASATGQNTRNTANNSANGVQFGVINYDWAFDDIYICDTAGSVNNDFLGDIQVVTIQPTGAGSNTGFTPSAGANYAAVDDTTPDDDTTYVEHATASTRDTYAFADLAGTVTAVKGVQTVLLARKTDSGSKTLGDSVKSGATTSDGTAVSPSTSYTYLTNVRETDPDTAAAWTASGVNAAEFGMKVGA
jgi:hypothetical protein